MSSFLYGSKLVSSTPQNYDAPLFVPGHLLPTEHKQMKEERVFGRRKYAAENGN